MYAASLDALLTKLKATSFSVTVAGQTVNISKWWVDMAIKATYPYGLLVHNAGSSENSALNQDLVIADWAIQVIGDQQTANALLGEMIRTTLHNSELTTSYDWNVYRCQHRTVLHNTDIDGEKAIWFDGGVYRLRLSA